jgi:hypothetical protein
MPLISALQSDVSSLKDTLSTIGDVLNALRADIRDLKSAQTRLELRVSSSELPTVHSAPPAVFNVTHEHRGNNSPALEHAQERPPGTSVLSGDSSVINPRELLPLEDAAVNSGISAQFLQSSGSAPAADVPQQEIPPFLDPSLRYTYRGSAPNLAQFTPLEPFHSKQQYVLTLPSPPPFQARLTTLRDPHAYWSFEEDYGHYQMVHPHQAPLMRLVNFVDKNLLVGTLLLGSYLTVQNKHLLTDEVIRAAIADHYRRAITTRTQFLDCMESVRFNAPQLPRYLAHPESDLQPVLTYLHQLDKFYNLLAEMCPDAVPLEENYDRSRRTTIKFLVDQNLAPWLPIWRQQIFDDASKMKGKWPQLSAWMQSRIVAMQRHLSVSAYIYAAMEQANPRLNPEIATRKDFALLTRAESRPGFNRPRVLWEPSGKTPTPKPAQRPASLPTPHKSAATPSRNAGPALHAIEGDDYESDEQDAADQRQDQDDDLSADTLSYYTPPEEDVVNALTGVAQVCFTAIRGETCSKPGCTRDHSKSAVDRQLREWRTANDKRTA